MIRIIIVEKEKEEMGEVYNMHTTTGGELRWFDTETGEHTYNPHKLILTEPVDSYVSDMWKYNQFAITGGDAKSETTNTPKMTGWICPVCGRGLSPYTSMCPCKGYPKMEVTC
jgi:hypothetical protein